MLAQDTTHTNTEFLEFIRKFDQTYGIELQRCNVDAYGLLAEMRTLTEADDVVSAVKQFYDEVADELDACFPEAFGPAKHVRTRRLNSMGLDCPLQYMLLIKQPTCLMIDYGNATQVDPNSVTGTVEPVLVKGEQVELAFKLVKDMIVFTESMSKGSLARKRNSIPYPTGHSQSKQQAPSTGTSI